jgi:hypothetical protein
MENNEMRRIKSKLSSALVAVVALSALPVAASAQGASQVGPFDPRAGKFSTVISAEPARTPDTVAVSSDKVWAVLIQVYADLGIPLTIADTQSHVIGALRVVQRKPIGGQRLSRLLECGQSAYGPNAERYTVQLTALTGVQSIGEKGSTIDTRVGGFASPNGINSSVTCASSGVLEETVTAMVRRALGL